ncbi:hypothetical protein RY45_11560 [Aeromonas hydrophila]|nr:hypothetical protein RY45_11560 [Aeromonas hydrophila]
MPGTRNSYLAFFMLAVRMQQLGIMPLVRLLEHLCRLWHFDMWRSLFLFKLMLIEQIDGLLDERSLAVFELQPQHGQPLGVAIADPALQSAVSFLLAFHVLALPLGVVLRTAHFHFLAHITLQL